MDTKGDWKEWSKYVLIELQRLNESNEKIEETLTKSAAVQIKQEENLKDHMKRTELNEQKLELFERKVAPALNAYKFVATFIKFATIGAGLIGAYYEFFHDKIH